MLFIAHQLAVDRHNGIDLQCEGGAVYRLCPQQIAKRSSRQCGAHKPAALRTRTVVSNFRAMADRLSPVLTR